MHATCDPSKQRAEVERLQLQRDRAWLALARIEGELVSGSVQDIAWHLATSRGPQDVDEYNTVIAAASAAEEE